MRNKNFLSGAFIFIITGTFAFSNIISDKLESSVRIAAFPVFIMARPFVMSSGAEYDSLTSFIEDSDIKSVLLEMGVKETDILDVDSTEYGIFISKNDKILFFIANEEKNLDIFGKSVRGK